MSKRYVAFFTIIFLLLVIPTTYANKRLCNLYPHWHRCESNKQLLQIENYLLKNSPKRTHKPAVAAFDWDGTLYSEKIALHDIPKPYRMLNGKAFAGQPSWFFWSATQPGGTNLPGFIGNNAALINEILYTENKSSAYAPDYSKFSQESKLLVGMTPSQMRQSIQRYLKTYSIDKNVFLPMLDIVQRAHDLGYKTWIITGSNPYYVSVILLDVEKKYGYHFGILPNQENPQCDKLSTGCIAGNMTRLSKDGTFTVVYDDRFVKDNKQPLIHYDRNVVEKQGKVKTVNYYIEPREKAPVVLYAGNSIGDYDLMQFLLNRHEEAMKAPFPAFIIAVDSQHESNFMPLKDLFLEHKNKNDILILKMP